jgi:hypothetical protein
MASMWRGAVPISRHAEMDAVMSDIEFEIHPRNLYPERQILIDALEEWLWAEQRRHQ